MRFAISAVPLKEGIKILRVAQGLDFTAIIMFAKECGAASPLFLDLLPEIEAVAVRAFNAATD